jgi:anthranilate phosphoribosyltransferase
MLQPAEALKRMIAGADLSTQETEALFDQLMAGDFSDPMKAALLVSLQMKGASISEIAGAAKAMRSRVHKVPHACKDIVDTCGTGGDGKGSFNISTAAALVAAGAGVPVAKHGNRSVSSRSGSADVLEALGISLDLSPVQMGQALETIGIAFLFAPRLHPAMAEVAAIRRELAIRTIFNVLGPITNPAAAERQIVGVFALDLVEKIAAVLAALGSTHALVVHGSDGLDEITTTGATHVCELRNGTLKSYTLAPEELGFARVELEDLAGGDPAMNAALIEEVLAGNSGALGDITTLNAAAAIYVGGLARSLPEGVELAQRAILSGAARHKLEQLRSFSASPSP